MSGEKSDKPKKSEPLDSDHLLMTTLAALVECENATRHDPQGFIKYKVKVKETLEILLSKLERNQYEQYLETEIEEFEDRLMMSSYNPANEDSRLDVIRDEDFPTLPTDERIDTGDSVEIIHRHIVSQLQDTIHELRLKEFTQAQAYETRIEHLERQLCEKEAELVKCTLQKEKEMALAGTVLASLRKKIDTIGYNIAVRASLPYPPPRVVDQRLASLNGTDSSTDAPPSPLEKYLHANGYTTEELLALDKDREHFLSHFEKAIEEDNDEVTYSDGEDAHDDRINNEEAQMSNSFDEAVDYKNHLLNQYDLDDEELSQLMAASDDDYGGTNNHNTSNHHNSSGDSGPGLLEGEVGYEELDGMDSQDDRDSFCDGLLVASESDKQDMHHTESAAGAIVEASGEHSESSILLEGNLSPNILSDAVPVKVMSMA